MDGGREKAGKVHFSEYVALSDLAAALCALANADGGEVILGVSAGGAVTGVGNVDEAIDRVFRAALMVEPPLVLPLPRLADRQGASVLVVTVPPGLPHVYHLEGRYLVHRAGRIEALSSRALRALLMQRGVVSFEAQIVEDAALSDLDEEQVEAYRQALNLPPDSQPWEMLFQRGCLRRQEGELRPTYAALLLFGRQPQRWLPSARILAARFSGKALGDEFIKQEIEGTLPQQLRRAEAFVRDHLRQVARLSGLQRVEVPEYPLEAVRELLVNAVAHRDYNQQGDTIHLHVFADRLEVHSPGGLPGPVTLDNLLEARFSRNPVIAQVLSDLGFVERLGYGLNRV
ncbi:MAG: transcriptional regulator, partial [Anaerolineae bacterium]